MVFFCISGIIALFSIINNTKNFATKAINVPFSVTSQFAMLDVFYTLNTTLPLSVLLAGILTFWRLSRTSELTVIRSIGLSVWQFIAPILGVCIFIGCLNMMVLSPINSALQQHMQKLSYKYEVSHSNPLLFSQHGLWLKEKSDFTQSFINAGYIKKENSSLFGKNLVIYVTDLNNNFLKRIEAESATINNKNIFLNNVKIVNPKLITETFESYDYPTSLTIDKIEENSSAPETFSFWELPGFISFFEEAGFSARKHRSYFYTLLFMPLSLCAMLLISSIFSISPKRNQSNLVLKLSGGVLAGFGIFFLDQVIHAMGASGKLPLLISSISIPFIAILFCITVLLYHEDG
ncbi:MAG: LptF/LptG family permease [Alphaproteobacteria bacterium]|nr:LptF/LptG family permease [Alphaproteobacteria bacterium]